MKLVGIKQPRHLYWRLTTNLILVVILLPLLFVTSRSFILDTSNLKHVVTNLFSTYITNTSILVVGTSFFTLIVGVLTAWFVSIYEFPFRKYFEWMLILPLSIPTFINAIAYVGLTDYAGPIQIMLRSFGINIYFDIMNQLGATVVMGLVLYPYVYVTTRATFLLQSTSMIEVSRSLGKSMTQTFIRVVLPLTWPAIFAGLILIIMEVINDYGVVSYFGIPTFTIGIFRSWLALGDLSTAVFLSLVILIFILLLLLMESAINNKKKISHDTSDKPFNRIPAKNKWLLFLCCSIPLFFGFLVPVGQLLWWFVLTFSKNDITYMMDLAKNTTLLGTVSSIIIVLLALVVAYTFRLLNKQKIKHLGIKIPFLGYALPGTVIAVGIVSFVLLINPNFIYLGIGALTFGYVVRFFAVGYGSIEAGLKKIPQQMDDTAVSLGSNSLRNFLKIHIPILKPVLIGALIMVFVDVAKELPLTLILRPFNYETLATNAFQYAKDEMAPRAASSSLLIIFASVLPIYYLNKILPR